MSYTDLHTWYMTNRILVRHNFSYDALQDMMPFERDIYAAMIYEEQKENE